MPIRLIYISLLITLSINSFGQEFLLDLNENPLTNKPSHKSANISSPLELPFIDDFSNNKNSPNQLLWVDSYAFINNGYPKGQPTIGVATLDALNEYGKHYDNASSDSYIADKLTSQAIDLGSVDKESLFMSFFYQPQGNGNAPELNDTLILQFKDTAENWKTVWYSLGHTYESFRTDTLGIPPTYVTSTLEFKQVVLPVNNTAFTHSNFQFRFLNYVTLTPSSRPSEATNCDHWNIDYVYLDTGRTIVDTIHTDIAFVEPTNPFIRKYTSVPWAHYDVFAEKHISKMTFHIRNNADQKYDVSPARIYFYDNYSSWEDYYGIGSKEIDAYSNNKDLIRQFNESPIEHNNNDSAEFTIKCTIDPGAQDIISSNDTAETILSFKNYYAYDDGTAEKRYGIDANGGYVAYRFVTSVEDTIRGASMFFLRNNPEDYASNSFALCIWDCDNGKPGELRVIETGKSTNYGESLNEFTTIHLDTAVAVKDTFFIGWKQLSDEYLHVGFDANNRNKDEIFYSIYGRWFNTSFHGSLMIRPILSSRPIKSPDIEDSRKSFSISPNPTNGSINISFETDIETATVYVFDISGQMVKQDVWDGNPIDLNSLQPGLYFLRIITEYGEYSTQRVLVY